MTDPFLDWRRTDGKERRIRETFPDALPRLWWFRFHDRRPPTPEELAELTACFSHRASVLKPQVDVFRSTGLQGNPYVVAFSCEHPADACLEIVAGECVCPLYLVQNNALGEVDLNFVTEFGESDNPFRQNPAPSPGI